MHSFTEQQKIALANTLLQTKPSNFERAIGHPEGVALEVVELMEAQAAHTWLRTCKAVNETICQQDDATCAREFYTACGIPDPQIHWELMSS